MTRLLLGLLVVSPTLLAQPTSRDVEKTLQRDFHSRGQATMDRVVQDGVQRVCTESRDRPPAELAKTLEAEQMKTIAFPEGSLLGDWKRGEAIAQSGRGLTWNDASGQAGGGSCYNCHQLSPKEVSFGTIGPSLRGFGKARGASTEVQRYVYGKIYNAKAYNLCSHMPRLGVSGTLTAQQIKDLVSLLLDPTSPVNE
ncbi:MAG TPA: sulfur oxidation c-type cytochrome SoxX [Burkholderiales bacterium]|nr:sulfur oxidation c-type cytochrome SoxX [Burkholderiales bacterium]